MPSHLFLLCMEYLSRLLAIRTRDPEFHFHHKCFLNRITHLAFADDLLFFVRGDPNSMQIIVDCLEEFTNNSRLKINKNKS